MANRVRITLTGEGGDAEQALRGVENRLERVQRQSRKTSRGMEGVNRVSSTMVSRLQGMAGAAGVAAGAAGMGYLINRSLTAQEELLNLHKTTGIAIERIQEYQFAARKSGVAQERINDALSEMSQRMGEAIADYKRTGGEITEMGEGFQAAGISMQQLQRMSPTQTFDALSRAIQEAENEQTALNIAAKTFGDESGRSMVAMLREGEGTINDYIERAHELGIVLDEDVVRQSVEAKKSITTLSVALESQFHRAVGKLAPSISELSDDMGDWIANNEKFIEQDLPSTIRAVGSAAAFAVRELAHMGQMVKDLVIDPTMAAGQGAARAVYGSADSTQRIINDYEDLEAQLARVQRAMGNIDESHPQYDQYASQAEELRSKMDLLERTMERLASREQQVALEGELMWEQMAKMVDVSGSAESESQDRSRAHESEAVSVEGLARRYRELYLWMDDLTKLDLERSKMTPPSAVGLGGSGADDEWVKEAARQREVTEAMAKGRGIGEKTFGADDEWARAQIDNMSEFEKSWQEMLDNTWSATQNWQDLVTDGFSYAINSMSRTLTDFIMTGEMQWKEFASSVIEYITQMWIKWQMWQAVKNASSSNWGGLFGGTSGGDTMPAGYMGRAQGGVFENGQPVNQYAQGGVVNQPTVFPMTNGTGLMGEDGPEAVMPLQRTKSGDLGVKTNQPKDNQETPPQINLTIVAADAKSFSDMIKRNPQAVIGPIKEALQYGDLDLRQAVRSA